MVGHMCFVCMYDMREVLNLRKNIDSPGLIKYFPKFLSVSPAGVRSVLSWKCWCFFILGLCHLCKLCSVASLGIFMTLF